MMLANTQTDRQTNQNYTQNITSFCQEVDKRLRKLHYERPFDLRRNGEPRWTEIILPIAM